MNVKNLLAYLLTLVVSVSLTACPDDCGTEEGGAEGGAAGGAEDCGGAEGATTAGSVGGATGGATGGAVAGTDVTPAVYNVLRISDASGMDDDGNGTPGADVCEIDIVCGGVALDAAQIISVSLDIATPDCSASVGGACICAGTARASDPNCGTKDRSDNAPAANDDSARGLVYDGAYCPASGADDAYVSLGAFGTIVIEVAAEVNLADCTIEVDELGGDEDVTAEICDADNNCMSL